MPEEIGSATADTTNSYADLIKVKLAQTKTLGKFLIWLKENNVNAIKFKILGSQDDTNYEELKAETVLAKNASTFELVAWPWLYVKVQHKADSGGSQGKTTCIISGS